MELSSELLKLLVCPLTGEKLEYDKENKELISKSAGLAYPIIDSIPIILVDHARKIKGQVRISTAIPSYKEQDVA